MNRNGWTKEASDLLLGKRIVKVEYMSKEEADEKRKTDADFKRSKKQKKKGSRKYSPSSGSIQRVPCAGGGIRKWDPTTNDWTCE